MGKWLKRIADTPLETFSKVIDSLDVLTDDRTNAPSIRAVNEGLANKWMDIYPIGSIYMSCASTDPSQLFGGTWVRIKDCFLLALGDTWTINGQTGGEATHTLTANEIPSHNHSYTKAPNITDGHSLGWNEQPPHTHAYKVQGVQGQAEGKYFVTNTGHVDSEGGSDLRNNLIIGAGNASGTATAHTHGITNTTADTGSKGGGQAHNNMPPFMVVNVWTRTA